MAEPKKNKAETMRLQKFLAHAGVCSRRAAEALILDGRIQVNGAVVDQLGTQVDPVKDRVTFDGKPVKAAKKNTHIYLAVNKPRGVITSCSHKNAKIILDLIPIKERVYPVGRLDKDSDGLVLLTNDGDLHNKLSHPSHNHEKEYRVTTLQPFKDKALTAMANGVVIEGEKTRKAKVKRLGPKSFKIILKQGRNRQIRKMVSALGNKVDRLQRIRMSAVGLGNLKPGGWRHLTDKEVKSLKQLNPSR